MIPIFSPSKKARRTAAAVISLFTGKDFGTEVWFAGDKQSTGYFCKVDTSALGEETSPVLIDPSASFLVDTSGSFRALEIDGTGTLISSPYEYGSGISTFDRVSAYSYSPIYEVLNPFAEGGFLTTHLVSEPSGDDIYFAGSVIHNVPTGAIAKIFSSSYPALDFLSQNSFGGFKAICNMASIGVYVFITFLRFDGVKFVQKGVVTSGSVPNTSETGVTEVFCSDGNHFYGALNTSYPADDEAPLPVDAGKVVKLDSTGSIVLTSAILADFILTIGDTNLETFLNVIVLNQAGDGKYKNSSIEVLQVRKSDLTVIRSFSVNCAIPYAGTIGADTYGYFSAGSKVLRIPPPPMSSDSGDSLTIAIYSAFDNRIYVYSASTQKLHIYTPSLQYIGFVQTPWSGSFAYPMLDVTASGKILFTYHSSGSPQTVHYYDIPTGEFSSFQSLSLETTDIAVNGNDVYLTSYWYTSTTVLKLNTVTGVWTGSASLSTTQQLACFVAGGFVWALSSGLGRAAIKLHKLTLDLQTVVAEFDVPNSGNRQPMSNIVFASGRLWFGTYSLSSASARLESFNILTEAFASHQFSFQYFDNLNNAASEDFIYLSSAAGIVKFSIASNSVDSIVGTAGDLVNTQTSTNVISTHSTSLTSLPL